MGVVRRLARQSFERVEDAFDGVFGPARNPFYRLGALGWFCYWVVAVSGIYLYVFFDTGVSEAYHSVEALTHAQWYAGGVMRSLHRYASDMLVVVMTLHLLREYALDRYRGKRWFAWLTGVPLLWLVYACGVSGYWLVWDQLAQYIAVASGEWLDTLPLFGGSIARNFLNNASLSSRFFSLLVFVHIALPLIALLVMWIHIQRHARPKVNPPRGLALGTLLMLLTLSLIHPARSQGPADLDRVPAEIGLDWFYLSAYPLLDYLPGGVLWAVFAAATLLLLSLPWLPPARRPAAAAVDLGNCNGCARCADDCPFSAIIMGPRTDGAPYPQQAVVSAAHCTGCGLCAGACPTAMPFRRATDLIPGIDLPQRPLRRLREQTVAAAADLDGADSGRVIVYGCDHAGALNSLAGPGVAILQLPCLGGLPPSFLDFVISRRYADGVFLAGCREGDCHYRLGAVWTEQRIDGRRDPRLRRRVPRERIGLCLTGPTRAGRRGEALAAFRTRLRALGPWQKNAPADPVRASGD